MLNELFRVASNCAIGSYRLEPFDLMRSAAPTATPSPFAFAENIPGATGAICVTPLGAVASDLMTVKTLSPVAAPAGIRRLICAGETKNRGARLSLPAPSLTLTEVFASVVGRGIAAAACVSVASAEPKIEAIDSRATALVLKLAADAAANTEQAPSLIFAVN